MPDVLITYPNGKQALVDEGSLSGALATGATVGEAKPAEDPDLLGAVGAGLLGAASTASLGLSDRLIRDVPYIASGRELEKQVTGDVKALRERHPYAEMAGEVGGLLLNPEALAGAGEAAAGAVAARAGEGLVGKVLSPAARMAVESAMLGAQHQTTEDALGDHEYNGEAVYTAAAKEVPFGLVLGGGFGALGHGARALGLVGKPAAKTAERLALDELVGTKGAGEEVASLAAKREETIAKLRAEGMTSEQAVKAVGDMTDAAKAASEVDSVAAAPIRSTADAYAGFHSPEQAANLRAHAKLEGGVLDDLAAKERATAVKMTDSGTKAFRVEDLLDNIQYGQKAERYVEYVPVGNFDKQLDEIAQRHGDLDAMLAKLEADPQRGGMGVGVRRLRDALTASQEKFAIAAQSGGTKEAVRDLYIDFDNLRKKLDGQVPRNRPGASIVDGKVFRPNVPEAVPYFEEMADRFRKSSRNEEVWGEAGFRHGREQDAFSRGFERRRDLRESLGSAIDREGGVTVPEIDVQKAQGLLKQITGDTPFDEKIQTIKSLRAWHDSVEHRAAVAFEGGVTPKEAEGLKAGLQAARDFRATFEDAFKEAAAANKVRDALGSEAAKPSVGGVLGLVTDAFTKPHTTMERLLAVGRTVKDVERSTKNLVRAVFGEQTAAGAKAASSAGSAAKAAGTAPRAPAAIAHEMETIRETVANPQRLEQAAQNMVGDLSSVAPKTANEARLAAIRALVFLAKESPAASTTDTGAFGRPATRYSDTQLREWETKRNAAFDPRTALGGLKDGHLNREAIRTAEIVAPRLFAQMQETAQDEIARLEYEGKLDTVPYNRRAAIATLLKVPADRTWEPQFIASMQGALAAAPEPPPAPRGGGGGSSPAKPPTWLMTEAQEIEGGIG